MIKREPGDLRQTITHRITQRFFVRWHMAAILVCVMLSGVVCSALLLHLGLRSMPWRYLLAVTGSYLIFFALIRLWLLYVSIAGSGRSVPGAGFGDLGTLGGGAPDWSSGGSWSSGSGSGWDLDLDDGWLVLVAFALLLLAVTGSGAYLIYQAPHILGEAAFQVALATSLRGAARRVVGFGWTGSVLRSTWMSFSIVLAMAGIFGGVAQHYCSKASKITEVLFACFLSF